MTKINTLPHVTVEAKHSFASSHLCPLSLRAVLQLRRQQQCQGHRVNQLPELRVQHAALFLPRAPVLTTTTRSIPQDSSAPPLFLLGSTQLEQETRYTHPRHGSGLDLPCMRWLSAPCFHQAASLRFFGWLTWQSKVLHYKFYAHDTHTSFSHKTESLI